MFILTYIIILYYGKRNITILVRHTRHTSMAFNKIIHWTLFRQFIDRGVSLHLVMILCYWYQKQEMTVRWGACTSDSFKVTNGVCQGGILPP